MTADFVFRTLLGHLVGDYLLQNNWMALNKRSNPLVAAVHCAIYTLCIAVFWYPEWVWGSWPDRHVWVVIFLSHLLLDATPLLEWWLRLIRGRSTKSTIKYLGSDVPDVNKQFMVAYTALVQTVADNTIHLLSLYLIGKYLLTNS